jgi:hypothetical protein
LLLLALEGFLADGLAQLMDLNVFAPKLVLELCLLRDHSLHLPRSFFLVQQQTVLLCLGLGFLRPELVLKVLDGGLQLGGLGALLAECILRLLEGLVLLGELGSDVLTEVDVRDPLLHHEVQRLDCILDVLRGATEEVAYGGHAVALLTLADVVLVILELLYAQRLLVFLLR